MLKFNLFKIDPKFFQRSKKNPNLNEIQKLDPFVLCWNSSILQTKSSYKIVLWIKIFDFISLAVELSFLLLLILKWKLHKITKELETTSIDRINTLLLLFIFILLNLPLNIRFSFIHIDGGVGKIRVSVSKIFKLTCIVI